MITKIISYYLRKRIQDELNEIIMFYCTKCGLCCKNLGKSEIYEKLNRGDGVCVNLDSMSSLCTIYENRPLICRIEASHKVFFPQIEIKQYLKMNTKICQNMQESSVVTSVK